MGASAAAAGAAAAAAAAAGGKVGAKGAMGKEEEAWKRSEEALKKKEQSVRNALKAKQRTLQQVGDTRCPRVTVMCAFCVAYNTVQLSFVVCFSSAHLCRQTLLAVPAEV